ncbi:HNH endonuclease domain-containing protein [Spirosoma montaniterrae]|nr:HNH endonuclease domain-containing protein [Spirosoma montaniterrae]
MRDLSLRMVANVWYPLDYFKLSFGKQDGFKPIADFVSERITVDNGPTAPHLFDQLNTRLSPVDAEQLHRKVSALLRWVPYRFVRPFFAQETRGLPDDQVNKRIVELAGQTTKVPYRFVGSDIELNNNWVVYLQQHQAILRGFTLWHLVRFLQKNNPNVIGLTEKLEKPGVRVLNTANTFWKEYLKANPALTCVYSGQTITTANLSLDHFLPWSFVAHDQLWNIIPTPRAVNSAKNDWLPSVDLYFHAYTQQQFAGFQFHAQNGHDKLLEDYSLLFGQSLRSIQQQPFTWFLERLERAVLPQLQTAQNLGFSYPFIYKS